MIQLDAAWPIEPGSFRTLGRGFARPECVIACGSGELFASCRGAGITRISPDGSQSVIGAHAQVLGHEFVPNGFCLLENGDFLIANIGEGGGVWRLARDGSLTPFLLEVDGVALSAANFVLRDAAGRIWITVSTKLLPRFLSYRSSVADGFVALVDEKGARIVADGLAFANELRINAEGNTLYVSETFGRRVARFGVSPGGLLLGRAVVAEFGRGAFPDGFALDAECCLWVTSIVSNRLYRVTPSGKTSLLLEDSDASHIDTVETALAEGRMGREHFYTMKSRELKNIASIAFGGADLRTAYLGSLLDDRLISFRTAVAGAPMVHR